MEKRQLGRTREKVAVIGMGTWKIGNAKNEARTDEIKALRRGAELGMTLIDTAEMYGDGASEQLVGEAVRGVRDEVFIASKVSPENFSYEDVIRSCEASVKRLAVKHIDLYQLHWPSYSIPITETMKAMEELVSRGKIRYIGVSNFSVSQTRKAREALPRSELASNQLRYSLTQRGIEAELLPFCEKERITIIAYSPLDLGRIPSGRIPKAMLDKYSMTAAQLMLNWVTYKDAVIAIPKASKVEHAEQNAASLDKRISRDEYLELSRIFA